MLRSSIDISPTNTQCNSQLDERLDSTYKAAMIYEHVLGAFLHDTDFQINCCKEHPPSFML